MVEKDRLVGVKTIAEHLDLSNGTVRTILHDDLGLAKRSAGWVLNQGRQQYSRK